MRQAYISSRTECQSSVIRRLTLSRQSHCSLLASQHLAYRNCVALWWSDIIRRLGLGFGQPTQELQTRRYIGRDGRQAPTQITGAEAQVVPSSCLENNRAALCRLCLTMPLKATLEHIQGSRTPCTFLHCSIRRIQQCSNVPIQIEGYYTSTTQHCPLRRVRDNDTVGNIRETR